MSRNGTRSAKGSRELALGSLALAALVLLLPLRGRAYAHRAASAAFRGVRYMLAWHDDHPLVHSWAPRPGLTLDPRWRRGFASLVEHDLSYDAWVYHHQLPALAGLARDFPEARIVLCHVGTPVGAAGPFHGVGATAAERDRVRGEWRDALAELASHDNVWCKISGLTMPVLGFGYHLRAAGPEVSELAEALSPFVRGAIEAFGVERCMLASNSPIDKVSVGYATLWTAYGRVLEELGLDEAARGALFGDNAARFYRLS